MTGAGLGVVGRGVLKADLSFEVEEVSERGEEDLLSNIGRGVLISLWIGLLYVLESRRHVLVGVCELLLIWKFDGAGLRPYADTGRSEVQ